MKLKQKAFGPRDKGHDRGILLLSFFPTIVLMALLLLPATLVVVATELDGLRPSSVISNTLTVAEERAVGKRLAYFYAQRNTVVTGHVAEPLISRIATRLQEDPSVPVLKIAIIKGNRADAVSFSGGHIFITTGLLEGSINEDELAAVLAHEAAHCAGRHAVHLLAEAFALPEEKRVGFPSRMDIVTGRAFNFEFPSALDASRSLYEQDADQRATELLHRAGYRVAALAAVLARISGQLPDNAGATRAALNFRVEALMTRRQADPATQSLLAKSLPLTSAINVLTDKPILALD